MTPSAIPVKRGPCISWAITLEALEAASPTIVGNAAYDALIARCAIKAGATVLLTWNVKHFMRLGSEVARLVKTPAEL
jgi:predicted nucleic acid-binding protein